EHGYGLQKEMINMRARRCVVSLVWSMLVIGAASLAPPVHAQFVYVANAGSNNVSAYSIGATGVLTPIAFATVTPGPTSVAAAPTGNFVYVAAGGTVSDYSIGATGALTVIGVTVATGNGSSSVAVAATGKFVYVANEFSNDVSAYSIGATGVLTPIGVPVA